MPVDFVSTHGYADDTVVNLFHTHEAIPMDQRVCRAIRKVHDQIASSSRPGLPLMWTEWNVPSFGPLKARDTIYVGAALADDVRQCGGLVDTMSYWTFDDVFEESGPVKEPFYGGFGLIAAGGIKKPSYYAYSLLHQHGSERISNDAPNAIVTRRDDGALVIALWNLVDSNHQGAVERMRLDVHGLSVNSPVFVQSLDEHHGNTLASYERMGKPRYPTQAQIQQLNAGSRLSTPEKRSLSNGSLVITLTPNALVLLEIPK
jgi:xylan 1,4-beta-xylosidase